MGKHPVTVYARDVVDGRIVAGRLVRLACERHLRDLRELVPRGYRFSTEHADHAIGFFPRYLRLWDAGPRTGEPFVLGPAWVFIVGALYGWLGPDGYRRFQTAYVEMGKGNVKSMALAGLQLYAATCDGEPGAQVYSAAVSREQAHEIHKDAVAMAGESPELKSRLVIKLHNIYDPVTKSFIRPISSEGRSLDGKRVHFAAVDELHEHPKPIVVDKMRAGTKGKLQPLVACITNSGYDRTGVCWRFHELSRRILEPTDENESWFAYVCGLDVCAECRSDGHDMPQEGCRRCDNWRDEAVWPKANPEIDRAVPRSYLRKQVREALLMPATQSLVKRLNFCIWTVSITRWLDMDAWRQCGGPEVTEAEVAGRPCYAGLDLGLTDDLSAYVRLWDLEDGRVAARAHYWAPEAAIARRPDRPWDVWRAAGMLTITPGDYCDYDVVEDDVARWSLESGVRELAYDKTFAQQMAGHLTGLGLTCIDMPQGFQLNESLRNIAVMVGTKQLRHENDPMLTWQAGNAIVRHGLKGEIRLDKQTAADKIDGIAALAMANARRIVHANASAPQIWLMGEGESAPASKPDEPRPVPDSDSPPIIPSEPAAKEPTSDEAQRRARDEDRALWNRPEAWR